MAVENWPTWNLQKLDRFRKLYKRFFSLDIFYHPIFGFFQKNRLFQQPLLFSPPILVTYSWCAGRFRVVFFSLRVTSSLCAISGLSHREQKALQAIPPLLEKVHGLPGR